MEIFSIAIEDDLIKHDMEVEHLLDVLLNLMYTLDKKDFLHLFADLDKFALEHFHQISILCKLPLLFLCLMKNFDIHLLLLLLMLHYHREHMC